MKTLVRSVGASLGLSIFSLSCAADQDAGEPQGQAGASEQASRGTTEAPGGEGAASGSGGQSASTGGADAASGGAGVSEPGSGGEASGTGGSPVLGTVCTGAGQTNCDGWVKTAILHEETFEQPALDNWVPELLTPESSSVEVNSGQLDVDVDAGATIWFKHALGGDISIEYEVTMVDEGGANDRVSDLNQFWKAVDPNNSNLFTRDGDFGRYDELLLYYVGKGGNNNSTTRFRKYPGDGSRDVISEYVDDAHLLVANKSYQIEIRCLGATTQYVVDGEIYFDYLDSDPIPEGHFGFRTVRSHARLDNFIVYRLEEAAP